MSEVSSMDYKMSEENICGFESYCEENGNALQRVANIPVVMSTWNIMQSYYLSAKKTYPTLTPYLEAAENLTTTAANIALVSSKPVVDRYGETVNNYANIGLDKLEDKVPLIKKDPAEIYKRTRQSATSLLSDKVDTALCTTENYVDYYLPEDEVFDKDDSVSSDEEEDKFSGCRPRKQPTERIREISNKVRQCSYKRAMQHWSGVSTRSKEALSKLTYTVDLIKYAQNEKSSKMINAANEKLMDGVGLALSNFHSASETVNKQLEEKVLVQAVNFSKQLNSSCNNLINYINNQSHLEFLMEKAKKARQAAENLYQTFSNKTSVAQLSATVMEAMQPQLKFIEENLLFILDIMADKPPLNWVAPNMDIDPMGGVVMEEIEAQLYGRPRNDDDIEFRDTHSYPHPLKQG